MKSHKTSVQERTFTHSSDFLLPKFLVCFISLKAWMNILRKIRLTKHQGVLNDAGNLYNKGLYSPMSKGSDQGERKLLHRYECYSILAVTWKRTTGSGTNKNIQQMDQLIGGIYWKKKVFFVQNKLNNIRGTGISFCQKVKIFITTTAWAEMIWRKNINEYADPLTEMRSRSDCIWWVHLVHALRFYD